MVALGTKQETHMAQAAATTVAGTPTNDLSAAKYAAIAKLIELGDGEKLREVLALLGVEMPREEEEREEDHRLTPAQKEALDKTYQRALTGEGKSYSWEETETYIRQSVAHGK
jgi:hypothetical protein